jgi:hypothetical protein
MNCHGSRASREPRGRETRMWQDSEMSVSSRERLPYFALPFRRPGIEHSPCQLAKPQSLTEIATNGQDPRKADSPRIAE